MTDDGPGSRAIAGSAAGACWTAWSGGDGDGSGPAQPPGRAGANQLRRQLPSALIRSVSANRSARSPGVAGYGLVQSAEGLLDAGVEVVRTLGVVLDCSGWLGRWLGEPCAGLVGDRAGLVALGAVEAIIRVGMRGVGHGDHPGSRSGWAARPAPRSEGNFQAPARGSLYPPPLAGPSQPCE